MGFVLSSLAVVSLSDFANFANFSYVNSARDFNSLDALSAIPDVVDIQINNNSLLFLTQSTSLSSYLNSKKTVSGVNIGFSGVDIYNTYYYGGDHFYDDKNININKSFPVHGNYMLVCPFKSDNKYNIIPLKSTQGITYEYNYDKIVKGKTSRDYDAIYFGNNQERGYGSVFAQYKADAFPVVLKSDFYTNVYRPDNIPNVDINDSSLIPNGAIAGNAPCNSDAIFFDKFGYENVTNHGFSNSNTNGAPLCLWLSGNTTNCDASAVWMERWYDPHKVTQGAAYIAQVLPASAFSPITDVRSTLQLLPKSKISYLRYGPERNLTFVNSFSGNLEMYFDKWSNLIMDEVHDVQGFAVDSISNETFNTAVFDGTFHYQIPPDDDILIQNNVTLGMWIYQDQWNCGIDTQYFGNFSNNEGYGLFFNTAATTELITFPTTSGFIYGFNNRAIRIFEKSINISTGVSASKIDYVTTDLYGARWLYDDINNKIYKLDTDDLLKEVINLPLSADIAKMQINSQNELFVLDTFSHNISSFDYLGTYVNSVSTIPEYNNFDINLNDNIAVDIADLMVSDNSGNVFKSLGINIYKNNVLFYHVGYKPQALNIDSQNNIWICYDSNKVLKLDPEGNVIFKIAASLPFKNESSIELNFVKENKNQCDYDVVWMVFNTNNYVIKWTIDGQIIKRLNITDVVNLKACKNFNLNVKGDFTGYENKRKYGHFADNSVISSTNPAISLKINLSCGTTSKIVQIHTPAKKLEGWNHLAVSHSIENNNTVLRLYINGIVQTSLVVPGIFFINYGTKVSPFIIGGHSGKLGAKNVERSLNNEGYFIGKLDDLRLYSKVLNSYELRGLALNRHYDGWEDMVWYMPTPTATYMEEIVNYNLNAYPGSKSNIYNIKIKNMQVTDETTQNIIRNAIFNMIPKITPLNTQLNEIIFE